MDFLKEGDSVIVEDCYGSPPLRGVIVGYNDLNWIIKLNNYPNKDYPYSCALYPHSMVKLDSSVKPKPSLNEVIENIRNSYKLMQNYCCGCMILKSEGRRSYEARAPIKNGKCSVCKKLIYELEKP